MQDLLRRSEVLWRIMNQIESGYCESNQTDLGYSKRFQVSRCLFSAAVLIDTWYPSSGFYTLVACYFKMYPHILYVLTMYFVLLYVFSVEKAKGIGNPSK